MKIVFVLLPMLFMAAPASAGGPERIVSIGGALTEIVYALGAGDLVVGSDTTSIHPEAAAQTEKVGYQRALSAEGVLSLAPDLVLMTEASGPPTAVRQLEEAGVAIERLPAGRSIEDVTDNIKKIGLVLGRADTADHLRSAIQRDAEGLRSLNSSITEPLKVLFILTTGSGAPMVAGANTAAQSIISLAGARNSVEGYEGYRPLTPEAAVSAAPDFILVTTQGVEALGGIEEMKKLPGLSLTPALQNDRIGHMDALYLLGFGPRTVEAAKDLRTKLYGS